MHMDHIFPGRHTWACLFAVCFKCTMYLLVIPGNKITCFFLVLIKDTMNTMVSPFCGSELNSCVVMTRTHIPICLLSKSCPGCLHQPKLLQLPRRFTAEGLGFQLTKTRSACTKCMRCHAWMVGQMKNTTGFFFIKWKTKTEKGKAYHCTGKYAHICCFSLGKIVNVYFVLTLNTFVSIQPSSDHPQLIYILISLFTFRI